MRPFLRRSMILATCLTAGLVWSGCEAKKATEYVAGVSTQVTVPRDLKSVRIDINVGGANVFCGAYRVYDGKVLLPRSLGAYANTQSAVTSGPVQFSITGVTDTETSNALLTDCGTQLAVGSNNVRVLRRSRQPYIPDEIRFIPMPLKYSCFDVGCGEEETCKGGKCVSATLSIDEAKAQFPVYAPDLVDGSNANCFNSTMCLGAAAPAVIVDTDTCTYAVANSASAPPPASPLVDPFRQPCTTSADCTNKSNCTTVDPGAVAPALPGRCDALPPGTPWDGTNVEIVYDGGKNREVLDLDKEEGFFVNDPAKPQQFRLAPGLCEMVKGVDDKGNPTNHRITAVRASGTCQPKLLAQPICDDAQLAAMGVDAQGVAANPNPPNDCSTTLIKPPKSALMVVVDNTVDHSAFFNADELKAIEFPLKDPAFEQTVIGLQYAPGATACTANAPPTIALEPAATVRDKLIQSFVSFDPVAHPGALLAGSPDFEGALSSAYATLGALPADQYYRRAVIVIGNREFNTEQCPDIAGTAATLASTAHTNADLSKRIDTYAIQLAKSPGGTVDSPLEQGLIDLVLAGSDAPQPDPNARGTKHNAKIAFQSVINTLATCVYDVDNDKAPGTADTISFTDPLYGTTYKVAPGACTDEKATGEGWGYGSSPNASKKRIFFCQDSCKKYQGVLSAASDFALLYQQPPIAVPVFAHKASCEPK